MKHADAIVERILYLDGLPNLQRLDTLHIGQTRARAVQERSRSRVQRASSASTTAIALCREQGRQRTSEELLTKILVSEEEHIDWLETQIGLIEELGETAVPGPAAPRVGEGGGTPLARGRPRAPS